MARTNQLLAFIEAELIEESDSLGVEDELLMSGRIDSLGLMRLIAFIDEDLGVEVPFGDILIENFESVARIDAYLDSIAADSAPSA